MGGRLGHNSGLLFSELHVAGEYFDEVVFNVAQASGRPF